MAVGTDVADAVDELTDAITREMVTRWTADPREWANESFAIAEAVSTGYCVKSMEHHAICPPART